MKEILNVIHNTIYQFFDVCSDDEEVPMSDKDKLLLEVNKAICNNLKALDQQPCEGMRDATEEERKSTKDYINSISKPTGLQFDDIYEELDFVRPHKKISVNLQLCEDAISRESVIEWLKDKDIIKTKNQEENVRRELGELPSVKPSYNSVKTELEPCEDCISRQAAIDAFERCIHELGIEDKPYNYGEMALSVQNVPPVKPQPKNGEWIEVWDKDHLIILAYKCSECGSMRNTKTSYCADCGADMRESEG